MTPSAGLIPTRLPALPSDDEECRLLRQSIRVLLLLTVLVTPWLLAAQHALTREIVCWVVLLSLGGLLLEVIGSAVPRLRIPAVTVLLLLAVLLAVAQLIPLPAGLLQTASPSAARLWSLAEGDLTAAEPAAATISLYPGSTRHDLGMLVLGVLVFLLGTHYFSTRRAQLWLWTGLAINGLALSVFSLAQMLTWNGRLFWTIVPEPTTCAFGPYANHNHAASVLNMCLGGGLALVLAGRFSGNRRTVTPHGASRSAVPEPGTTTERLLRSTGGMAVAVIVAGILCSLSRGAFVAMCAAGAVAVLTALVYQRAATGVLRLGVLLAVAVSLLSWLGLGTSVSDRLATLTSRQLQDNPRIEHWSAALQAVPEFTWTGSGLGTYRYLYPGYESEPGEEWFYHAENQYVETVVEGGVPGLLLLLLTIGLVAVTLWQGIRLDPDRQTRSFAIAALFVLCTESVHSLFNFGLYVAANMLMFALIIGGGIGWSCRIIAASGVRSRLVFPEIRSALPAAVLVMVMLVQGLLPLDEYRSRRALAGTQLLSAPQMAGLPAAVVNLEPVDRQLSDPQLADEIALYRLEQDAASCPGNAELQLRVAHGWIDLYRRREYATQQGLLSESDEQPASRVDPTRNQQLWRATSLPALHARIAGLWTSGRHQELRELRHARHVSETLGPAIRHLRAARRACPLIGRTHWQLSQLSLLTADPTDENPHLKTLAWLGRRSSELLFHVGRLHLMAGRTSEAFYCWRQTLVLSQQHESAILSLAQREADAERVVQEVLPQSPQYLVDLAERRSSGAAADPLLCRLLLAAARHQLSREPQVRLPAQQREYLLSRIAALSGDRTAAIRQLSSAVSRSNPPPEWHYELARMLHSQGDLDGALKQARSAARGAPWEPAYRQLLYSIQSARLHNRD